MNKLDDYIVTADGPVAGRRHKTGDKVRLTARAARYEHVSPAGKGDRKVEAADPKGDPAVKAPAAEAKATADRSKRSGSKE